jgi:hypothetical protein
LDFQFHLQVKLHPCRSFSSIFCIVDAFQAATAWLTRPADDVFEQLWGLPVTLLPLPSVMQ